MSAIAMFTPPTPQIENNIEVIEDHVLRFFEGYSYRHEITIENYAPLFYEILVTVERCASYLIKYKDAPVSLTYNIESFEIKIKMLHNKKVRVLNIKP